MVEAAELLPPADQPAQPTTTIVEYTTTVAALAELERRIGKTVYDCSTTKLMDAAKKDRAEVRGYRVALENMRVEIKAPALKRCREIDSEAARITAILERLEAIPDAAIKAEEARKEREKQERIAAEVKRVAEIQERIAELRGNQLLTPASGSKLIAEHITDLQRIAVDEKFAEFYDLASSTKAAALDRLGKMLDAAQQHEADQERLRLEREELARQRQAQEEANRKERERIAAEEAEAKRKRETEEADAATERKRLLDEQLAKLRAQAEEQEQAVKAQREAAQADEARRNREEDERRERIRKEDEGRAAVIRAREEALQAEQLRQQEELQRQQQDLEQQRAELERQQAALNPPVVAPVAEATEPEPQPAMSTEAAPVASEEFAPTANDIAQVVATEFGVGFEQAMCWCLNAFEDDEWPA
jgi:colicin import membrane protein